MNDILKYCIKVNGVIAYYPIYNKDASQPLESTPEMVRKYGWNNGKVSFVTEDGSYYVTPFCIEVAEALKKLGFTEGDLYVPFSNGDIPKDTALATRWETLCKEARRLFDERQKRERIERYEKIAQEKRLKTLPEAVYQISLLIPQEGLETSWFGEKSITKPVYDWQIPDCMGTYCQNNGKISFVDANGKMYVTPFCQEVAKMLNEAGYKRDTLFVPLSNGEDIIDPTTAARWEALCKEAERLFDERQKRERIERYEKIAQEKRLKTLPEAVYQISLLIPQEGLETSWFGEKSITKPVYDWQIPDCMGTYCQNNGKISFVDANGKMYVTPFCQEVAKMLNDAGYQRGSLFVPLSNGEDIIDPTTATRWERMCAEATRLFDERLKRERQEEYEKIAQTKYLKPLPEAVYQMSLVIPQGGLEISWMGQKDKTFPVDDSQISERIGKYCQNNGKIAFVDSNGTILLTPFCHEVEQMLSAAGSQRGDMPVPLSNGEEIANPEMNARWEKMCAEARRLFDERLERKRQEENEKIAQEKHLKPLPEEAYEMSLLIPKGGLEISMFGEKSRTRTINDWQLPECMGTYCQNNGRISFVDTNGDMLVTPFCQEVEQMLNDAGYQRGSLFVPLSNGEDIINPQLAEKWASICEKAKRQEENGSVFKP